MSRAIPNPNDNFDGRTIPPVGPRPMGPPSETEPAHLSVYTYLTQVLLAQMTMHSSTGEDSQIRPAYLEPGGLWMAPQGDGGYIVCQFQRVGLEGGGVEDRDVEVWRVSAEGDVAVGSADRLTNKHTITAKVGTSLGLPMTFDGSEDTVLDIPASSGFEPGMFMLFLCRKNALPAGWYYPSGEYVAQATALGQALLALPAQIKSDWGVTTSGTNISLFNNSKFFNGVMGRFPRMASGSSTAYQPGVVEADALRDVTGKVVRGATAQSQFASTGAFSDGSNTIAAYGGGSYAFPYAEFAFSKQIATAAENRPYSIHMTPAIYLGV